MIYRGHLYLFERSGRSPDPGNSSPISKSHLYARPPVHPMPSTTNVHTPAAGWKYRHNGNTLIVTRAIVFTATCAPSLNKYESRDDLINWLIRAI